MNTHTQHNDALVQNHDSAKRKKTHPLSRSAFQQTKIDTGLSPKCFFCDISVISVQLSLNKCSPFHYLQYKANFYGNQYNEHKIELRYSFGVLSDLGSLRRTKEPKHKSTNLLSEQSCKI